LAYSLDEGKTWEKYAQNPVLKNPGLRDFRDPKVFWHAPTHKWLMSLAVGDHIEFYSSTNLRAWHKESEFGLGFGSHEGVWECPDLIPLKVDGRERWVLIVSLVSGGPNGGSATQYFVGDFDGHQFMAEHTETRWLDQGPDNYAGVTWHNTGQRKVFIGWMSNWLYAKEVPTAPWRSAMTLPRDLALKKVNNQNFLSAAPSIEVLDKVRAAPQQEIALVTGDVDFSHAMRDSHGRLVIQLSAPELDNFKMTLSNDLGDLLTVSYNRMTDQYQIDRRQSGIHEFNDKFPSILHAQRIHSSIDANVTLYLDRTSVELFADHGTTVMTSLFFPKAPYTRALIQAQGAMRSGQLTYQQAW
jgi:fructan beta-fructosidase